MALERYDVAGLEANVRARRFASFTNVLFIPVLGEKEITSRVVSSLKQLQVKGWAICMLTEKPFSSMDGHVGALQVKGLADVISFITCKSGDQQYKEEHNNKARLLPAARGVFAERAIVVVFDSNAEVLENALESNMFTVDLKDPKRVPVVDNDLLKLACAIAPKISAGKCKVGAFSGIAIAFMAILVLTGVYNVICASLPTPAVNGNGSTTADPYVEDFLAASCRFSSAYLPGTELNLFAAIYFAAGFITVYAAVMAVVSRECGLFFQSSCGANGISHSQMTNLANGD